MKREKRPNILLFAIDSLLADPSKARRVLHWQPDVSFEELTRMMVEEDIALLKGDTRAASYKSKIRPALVGAA